jgi:hypothetical protein
LPSRHLDKTDTSDRPACAGMTLDFVIPVPYVIPAPFVIPAQAGI